MAGGLPFDPPAQFFRKTDTGRISGSANGFLPRRSGPINGGTSAALRCTPLRSVCATRPTPRLNQRPSPTDTTPHNLTPSSPRPSSSDPPPQRLPFAAGCGRATMLALFPPLLINNPTHPTLQAPHSSSLRLRSLPNAQAQSPSPITRKCSAEYSPALAHLNPTTRATSKPLNSARQSLHSLHFVTLSFRSVGKRCSAEKNSHRRCSPLRSVCATLPGARAN